MPTPNKYFDVHQVLIYLKANENAILNHIAFHKHEIQKMVDLTPWTLIQPHIERIELLIAQLNQTKSITAFINGQGYTLEDK